MKPLYVLLVGIAVGWAASGVDWSREAVGDEKAGTEWLEVGEIPEAPVIGPMVDTPFNRDVRKVVVTDEAEAGEPQINRFQISAYGTHSGKGCYVIDSVSGKLWHVRHTEKPELIADTLPQN